MDYDIKILQQYCDEAKAKFEHRRNLRELNSHEHIDYATNDLLVEKLDLSIKKNSAFVKRLKLFTESQKAQILDEIDKLNLTKFISEVAASLIEAKLKLGDIPPVIEVCTKLNRYYKDFSRHLLEQYSKYFPIIKRISNDPQNAFFQLSSASAISSSQSFAGSSGLSSYTSSMMSPATGLVKSGVQQLNRTSVTTSISPSKIRVDLRLFSELVIAGVLPFKESFTVLMNLLYYLMVYDKNVHQNANAILTFCKGCGDELLGLAPTQIQQLASKYSVDLPTSDLISVKRQQSLKAYFCDYLKTMQKHLYDLYEELLQLIARNNKVCKNKGEVSKESRELVESKKVELQKVQSTVIQLGELLGEEIYLPSNAALINEVVADDNLTIDAANEKGSTSPANFSQVWDDESTRSFYEDLIDLQALFPNLQAKVTNKKTDAKCSNRDKLIETNEATDNVGGDKEAAADQTKSTTTPPLKRTEDLTGSANKLDGDKLFSSSSSTSSSSSSSSSSDDDDKDSIDEPTSTNETNANSLLAKQALGNRVQPDQYFSKLSNCVNRDMIDSAAIDFIRFYNTKFGRRKLVKSLFNVQRTRLDLLPFFSRLTATIYPYVPRVGNELTNQLKNDFRSLFRKKDQINIESKVKNVRFIGELVKFNLFSKHEALSCLKMLLSDFTHHHIEMSCNLLETCGRYLYKSPDSHNQLRLLLEQMMRKKMLLSVDSKYVTMIENAYYFTNPPEVVRRIVEEPQVHIYVRYLLCECLNRSTIDKVVKKFKLLDWSDKNLAKFVINCMIEAYNLKFYNIRYLAALLAALNKDNHWISVAVIDGVVEDILLMMEINEIQFNQRRIPMIRYFGELYNYRLSDSSLVFKILYSLITYGIHYHAPEQTLNQIPMSKLDPPDNLFRIKLVCDLLNTCGHFLSNGQEKKKLDCYLLFFQRYYWCKRHVYTLHPYCMAKSGNQFPASTEYLFNDAISNLRPSFEIATSYSEAISCLQAFIDGLKHD